MRPDGTRVKDLPPLVAAIPYIMPKRYDAWNSITENVDEEAVKAYIRHWRRSKNLPRVIASRPLRCPKKSSRYSPARFFRPLRKRPPRCIRRRRRSRAFPNEPRSSVS